MVVTLAWLAASLYFMLFLQVDVGHGGVSSPTDRVLINFSLVIGLPSFKIDHDKFQNCVRCCHYIVGNCLWDVEGTFVAHSTVF